MQLGFIGASGLMGHGMARNLLAKGAPLGHRLAIAGHSRRERVADLLAAGAQEQPDPAALAAACDVVFLCVTGSPQVEQVVTGERGLLAGARAGLVIVDSSTSEPESSARLRERCAAQGVAFVDAPLTRGPADAEAGRLNIMVGAEAEAYATLQPLLALMAENVFHVGPPGAGHVVKLMNNFVSQAVCAATAEAFAVGRLAGVDPRHFVAVGSVGVVNSGLFQMMAKTLDGTLDAMRFELDNARKDLRYYTHLAEQVGAPALVGDAVHQSLALASALGHGRKFVPSLVEAQEQITGAKLVPRPAAQGPQA
jgi:3-hydroxyisobutyrate dehydrogenase-like beta-hydroxyacid dehydrogenase